MDAWTFSPLLASRVEVSTPVTVLFACLLVGLIACLALEEKLHAKKSVIAGIFAIVCLLLGAVLGVLPFERVVVGSYEALPPEEPLEVEVIDDADGHHERITVGGEESEESAGGEEPLTLHVGGHRLSMPVYIPGIDWSVIAIILGSSLFVDVTSQSGLFTWIALRVTKLSRGDPFWLLVLYGIMTVVFSAVLNNVTAMIIVGSLTAVSLGKLGQLDKLLGFLLIEGLLTNIGGLLTLISSVPNIIVGTTANIAFVTFFIKAAPYVALATAGTIFLGLRLFGIRRLTDPKEQQRAAAMVAEFDENEGVEHWGFFWFAGAMLILFILCIATAAVLPYRINHLGMGFIALLFAGVMLIPFKSEVDRFYRTVDWDLLGFFMALFVVIYVMEHAQVLASIGRGIEAVLVDKKFANASGNKLDATTLLAGSALFSSVTDNIPLSAMLASILKSLGAPNESGLWWSVIFGANLGGNLTPIGSASTLVAVTLIHKHDLHLSFGQFVKVAFPYALLQIGLAIVYVLVILPWIPG